jgi:hypothetical protein
MSNRKSVATNALGFLTFKIGEASVLNHSLRLQQAALEKTDNVIDKGLLLRTAHFMAHTMGLYLDTQRRWWSERQTSSNSQSDTIAWTTRNLEFAAGLILQIKYDLHVLQMARECPLPAVRMLEFFQEQQVHLGRQRASWFDLEKTLSPDAFRQMQSACDEHGLIILTLERIQAGLDDASSLHHRCEESLTQLVKRAPDAGKERRPGDAIVERVQLEQALGYLRSAASHMVGAEMHMHHLTPSAE